MFSRHRAASESMMRDASALEVRGPHDPDSRKERKKRLQGNVTSFLW
jgi:hypothetical protein